jgi:pyridinium-3,5-bisthiocarboxylic acid mononucleotide nickel chelatase
MTRVGWFHCLAGASGDMLLGVLVDVGVPIATLQESIDALRVEPIELSVQEVTKHGLAATKVDVHVTRSTVTRTWPAVRSLLEDAPLPDVVKQGALDVFQRLANAEALVHRTTPEQVHFHEIGGLDALADIVGAVTGLHALGLDRIAASPVATGLGMTRTEHGVLPVPGPAVLALLEGAPIYSGGVAAELCTPTGAAILASVVTEWGDLPPIVVEAVGVGAGDRDFDEVPNVLRLVIGEAVSASSTGEESLLLESNVDDLDPRVWPSVVQSLIDGGADDAWLTPIQMKKGRPALTVSALCSPLVAPEVMRVLFRETTTIGIRERSVTKHALERAIRTVVVGEADIRVKVARFDGVVVNAVPEYDDVAALAMKTGRPVKVVLAEAAAAAASLFDG